MSLCLLLHWSVFVLVFSLLPFIESLKVEPPASSSSAAVDFSHRTASFGPQPPNYAIYGRIQFADQSPLSAPTSLCPADGFIPPLQPPFNNSKPVLLIVERGNCSFLDKAVLAQQLGASALIVGNTDTTNDQLIGMSFDSTSAQQRRLAAAIHIPVVFILRTSLMSIMSMTKAAENNKNSSSTPSTAESLFGEVSASGEALVDSSDTAYQTIDSFRFAAFLLILLPVLWCSMACVWVCRRVIINKLIARERSKVSKSIPIVPYNGTVLTEESQLRSNERRRNEDGSCNANSNNTTTSQTQVNTNNICVSNQNNSGADAHSTGAIFVNVSESTSQPPRYASLNTDSPAADSITLQSTPNTATPTHNQSKNASPTAQDNRSKRRSSARHRQCLNATCTICLENFVAAEPVKLLDCNHCFHAACISPWLDEKSELCPICRASVLKTVPNIVKFLRFPCCVSQRHSAQPTIHRPQQHS